MRSTFLILLCWASLGSQLLAKEPLTTADQIRSTLETVEKSSVLTEETKVAIRNLYQRALAQLKTAGEEAARGEQFARIARTAPEDLGRARRELSLLPETAMIEGLSTDHLDRLQARLTEAEVELAQYEAEYEELSKEPERRAARRRDFLKERMALRSQLEEMQRQLDAAAPPDEPPPLSLARQTLLQATMQALSATLAAGASELDAYQATIDLLPVKTDLAAARVALSQQIVKAIRKDIERRKRTEVDQHLLQAAIDLAAAAGSIPLTERANANVQLVERRKAIREQIDRTSEELAAVARTADKLDQQRTRSQNKVDAVGLTGAIGLMLRKQKTLLPDVSKYRAAVRQRQAEMKTAQLAALELADRRADLADLDAALARGLAERESGAAPTLSEEEQQHMRAILAAERRYTIYLLTDTNAYVELLLELDGAQRQLIADTEKFEKYIDERVLWVRSADTLSAADISVMLEAARHYAQPAPWRELGAALAADFHSHLVLYCLVLLAVIPAWIASWRMTIHPLKGRMRRAGANRVGRVERLVREVLEIILRAAPWPLLMWFLGHRLSGLPSESGFVRAFGVGLASMAIHLAPLLFLYYVCQPRGFAKRRLGWSKTGVHRIRRILGVLIWGVLPLGFIYVTLNAQDSVRWQDSLGRICLIASLLIVALISERLLRPRTGILYRTLRPPHHITLLRLRWPLYLIGVGVHVGLAVLTIVGFTYAAGRLGQQVRETELLFLALLLVGSLLTQWTRLNDRRRAIRRLAQRRPVKPETGIATEFGIRPATASDDWLGESKTRPDSKIRSLITAVLVLVSLIGIWYIWVDVIPAMSFVNHVEIWDSGTPAALTAAADQPADTSPRPQPAVGPVTLGDMLTAIFVLLGVFVVARYIAGLFELPVIDRIPLDPALRNTITTVTRYALWVVGVMVAAGFLGISWGKVQWMVAALSVGLGFGLQEIFVNFISGLIILFERPMRVGDVITIGDATGVVQAIRLRATTITDWDRRELVVPNKEFVTARLLNWTLTNKTNRRVIQVGVEYGTDPDLVRDLLLKVARQNPRVLDTPKPIALFQEFTDSSLLFSLRVYHPKISDRLRGLHELNTAIARELTAAGIRFAFPQRDLHLRTPMPAPPSWIGPEEEGNSENNGSITPRD